VPEARPRRGMRALGDRAAVLGPTGDRARLSIMFRLDPRAGPALEDRRWRRGDVGIMSSEREGEPGILWSGTDVAKGWRAPPRALLQRALLAFGRIDRVGAQNGSD